VSAIAARPGVEERLARLLEDHQAGTVRVAISAATDGDGDRWSADNNLQ
jgi:hypothetical protein